MMFFSARRRSRYCSVRMVAVNSPGRKASFVLQAFFLCRGGCDFDSDGSHSSMIMVGVCAEGSFVVEFGGFHGGSRRPCLRFFSSTVPAERGRERTSQALARAREDGPCSRGGMAYGIVYVEFLIMIQLESVASGPPTSNSFCSEWKATEARSEGHERPRNHNTHARGKRDMQVGAIPRLVILAKTTTKPESLSCFEIYN